MDKQIELAKKLKALAEKGIGGEKTNAKKMLDALMKKHNISIEDIEGEKHSDFFFKIDKSDYRFWFQLIMSVNYKLKCYGEFTKKDIKAFKLKGNYMVNCTASEAIEIGAKWDFYKSLYDSELKIFYSAFIQANRLYTSRPLDDNDKDVDNEELKRQMRILEMSSKITVGKFNKQLS